jgi:hypothetical protein
MRGAVVLPAPAVVLHVSVVLPLIPVAVFPAPAAVLRARATVLEAEVDMRSRRGKVVRKGREEGNYFIGFFFSAQGALTQI